MKRALGWVALLAVCAACGRSAHREATGGAAGPVVSTTGAAASSPEVGVAAGSTPSASASSPASAGAPGAGSPAVAGDGRAFGAPRAFDNLTVLPVLSKKQEDIGPIMTLDAALAKGVASVHEIGADQGGAAPAAQVNALVIENKGKVPIYVLAGTIVKGGKQDRQIGEDFIVGALQTVPVDAYCVEHGRWATQREGVATGGQFGVVGLLTDSRVRTAAEYGKDQGEVWSKVDQVNAANKKQAPSGTLLASVDAGDLAARRTALARKVEDYLGSVQPADDVVGFAYAVDGKVRSVRWFASHQVFVLFRPTLVGTAAMEAITAQSAAASSGKPPTPPPAVAAKDVAAFVDQVESAKLDEQRATPALNVNEVRHTKDGYGTSTKLKPPAAQPTAAPKPVSTSVTSF
jgi:hypothetical protein